MIIWVILLCCIGIAGVVFTIEMSSNNLARIGQATFIFWIVMVIAMYVHKEIMSDNLWCSDKESIFLTVFVVIFLIYSITIRGINFNISAGLLVLILIITFSYDIIFAGEGKRMSDIAITLKLAALFCIILIAMAAPYQKKK